MKRFPALLVLVIVLCMIPETAFADGPGPSPNNNYLLIDDYSKINLAEIWGYDKDNVYELIEEIHHPEETKVPNQRLEYFYNSEGKYKNFQLVITFRNGEKVKSNLIDIVEWGSYIYTVKDNTLKQGRMTTLKPNSITVFIAAILLFFPLGFTLLVEWLVSLAFRLKPGKYVIIINAITNPVMNILLMLLFVYVAFDYWLALIALETLAAGAEFWFYTWKYKGYTKIRLLLFTLTANAASWGLYWLLSSWMFH